MNILIANPPWPGEGYGARSNVRWPHRRGDKRLSFPIYLAYASSLLKRSGFKVKAVDAVWEEWGISEFVLEAKKAKPDVIFLEVSTPSIMFDLETAESLHEEMPGATIVFGGPHASYFHERIIENYRFVDVCIRGEFEYTLKDICETVKKRKSLSEIKGITFRNKMGNTVINEERPLKTDIDDFPYPDRESFPIERYQQAFYAGKKTALVLSSRGCPFRCTYCLWPSTLTYRRYRRRDPKKVVDEIEHLIEKEGIDEVFFDDDEFVMDKKKVADICGEMIRRGISIKWQCMGRVDMVDSKTLGLMKRAGCYQIFYGFESGSEKILKSVKKGITTEQTKKAVELTKKAGIVCGGSFVLGSTYEDNNTANETIKFSRTLGADWVQFTLCAPFPGTPMYEEAKNLGLLEVDSWSDFDGSNGPIMRTKYLSREELSGLQRKAYISYYTAPRVIITNLLSIRSLEQARRVIRGIKSVLSRVFYYKE